MHDGLRDLWNWLTAGLEAAVTDRDVAAVSDALTSFERTLVILSRALFAALELALFLAAFAVMPGIVGGLALRLPTLIAVAVGIGAPVILWFLLRKPRVWLRDLVLRRLIRPAQRRARAHEAPVLDATSASASPVAISVDVDHTP